MPRKSLEVSRYSIHKSQLYNSGDPARAIETVMTSRLGAPSSDTQSAQPTGILSSVVHLWRALRDLIYAQSNTLRWELSSPFTIPLGPGTTALPYGNENIGGDGVDVYGNSWSFSPPVRYAGAYHVGAFVETLVGLAHACKGARLELWVTNKLTGANRLWSVIDKQYINAGEAETNLYLEQLCLHGCDIVDLECHEMLTVHLWTNLAADLVISDMTSLYGYVYLHWCGCRRRRTDIETTPYNLPLET